MLKALLAIAALALAAGLSGCATTGDQPGPYAGPHNHARDAKQGYAAPLTADEASRKPFHDHREWK